MPDDRWLCVFAEKGTKAIDDRIQERHKVLSGKGAPWGAIRRIWPQQHCRTLNPYGDARCPYTLDSCRAAYQQAVEESFLDPKIKVPVAFFTRVARNSALRRGDDRPSHSRDVGVRRAAGRQDHLGRKRRPGPVRAVAADGPRDLRGTSAGPRAIGDLLGATDRGTRPHHEDPG